MSAKAKEPLLDLSASSAPVGEPGVAVQGNVTVDDDGNTTTEQSGTGCTAVYRSAVAGMRVFVGEEFMDACNTHGEILFIAAGHPRPHPHDREQLLYPYGEFCTADCKLVARLDDLIACRQNHNFYRVRVANPQPIGS